MNGRLRLAGLVEFGGDEAPASEAPYRLLLRQAQRAFRLFGGKVKIDG